MRTGKDQGPYSFDFVSVKHRNATVKSIVNASRFDSIIKNLDTAYEYEVGYVPQGYEHRPDLISNVFYGTPKHWWLLLLVNGISDPFEGFNVNQRIFIPKL
jgi:hypothetical protein